MKKKRPGGRPSKLTKEVLKRAIKLARMGLSDAQIAVACECSVPTLWAWKKKPEFLKGLKAAKESADEKVKVALQRRAMGYSHTEEKVFCSNGQIVTHRTRKHYPPDTEALKFWLTNRRAEEWSNKQKLELPEDLVINVTIGGEKNAKG